MKISLVGGYPYAAEAWISATLLRTETAIAMYVVRVATTAVALGNYVIVDTISGHGWSVVASGPTSKVTDPYEVEQAVKALPQPWASNEGKDVVCVHVELLQGRRFQALERQGR